jgi:glycogen debranching enzyme
MRLPELFCGFPRSGELDRPVPYPVACAPQAWASGASFLLLQSILGLCPDAAKRQLIIKKPTLPNWLNRLNLTGLRVGDSTLDLQFVQASGVTSARVMSKSGGPIKVLIEG